MTFGYIMYVASEGRNILRYPILTYPTTARNLRAIVLVEKLGIIHVVDIGEHKESANNKIPISFENATRILDAHNIFQE